MFVGQIDSNVLAIFVNPKHAGFCLGIFLKQKPILFDADYVTDSHVEESLILVPHSGIRQI